MRPAGTANSICSNSIHLNIASLSIIDMHSGNLLRSKCIAKTILKLRAQLQLFPSLVPSLGSQSALVTFSRQATEHRRSPPTPARTLGPAFLPETRFRPHRLPPFAVPSRNQSVAVGSTFSDTRPAAEPPSSGTAADDSAQPERHPGEPLGGAASRARRGRRGSMANSKYEYVKQYELDDSLLPGCWIVVRIDGKGFTK